MKQVVDSTYASCKLDGVIVYDKDSRTIFVYQDGSLCCGTKGVLPKWAGERSICVGPKKCVLLEEGSLYYPPDKSIWFPLLEDEDWEEIKVKFLHISDTEMSDIVKEHIHEQQRKWGI